jgi:hydroxyacylglutathione hydrolase
MFVQPFFVKGLAHSSYLLAGTTTCAIVDPRRDVEIYLDAAKDMGMKITHILETHLHADFISGHLDLAARTGATIVAPKSAKCRFKHKAVAEGDRFKIEDMVIAVLDTPGHTPEHITYVVTDKARGSEAVSIFCGDVLFVGDVGRPDLFPGKARQLASKLYDNLHQKLLTLPDFCEVYPAHGAGSLCGRAMGAKRTTTIGYERRYNTALQIKDKDKFIKSLTTNMPAAPDHFSRCSAINGKGPALVEKLPRLVALGPQAFAQAAKKKNMLISAATSRPSPAGFCRRTRISSWSPRRLSRRGRPAFGSGESVWIGPRVSWTAGCLHGRRRGCPPSTLARSVQLNSRA